MSHYQGSIPDTRVIDDWQTRGDCHGQADLFFSGHSQDIRDAKNICSRCPVVDRCRQLAMETHEAWGVWGGLSEQDRRRIHRRKAANLATVDEDEPEEPRPGSLKEAWQALVLVTEGGHLTWTGRNSLYWRGVTYTPRRAAFTTSRGRKPFGHVEAHCGVDGCVQPKHLTDVKERAELAAAGTPVRSPRYAPCGTTRAYERHRKNGEPIDEACRQAYNASRAQYARTGSTKVAA